MSDATVLRRLEQWFLSHCNGDWEHGEGVKIRNLDNPGWRVEIALDGTDLESRAFDRIEIERSEDDWLHAWVVDDVWNAAAGPLNLTQALTTFLSWADS